MRKMYRYSFQGYDKETMARALGRSLSISTKHAIEIANYIRGKKLSAAQKLLELAIEKKKPIPFRRFTEGAGHKKGVGPGKFVVKASREILKLLREVEANATAKGIMDPVIIHISAKKASIPLHYGRRPGRKMKRTHVEVVVTGIVEKKEKQGVEKKKEKEIKTEEKKEEKIVESKEGVKEKIHVEEKVGEHIEKEKQEKKQEKEEEKKEEKKEVKPKRKTTRKSTGTKTKRSTKKTTKTTKKKKKGEKQ
ncbi:50S ribosomal protein L22 [Candidatus Woesearchaeota archaeon]|nr:50S ribosomal protein L22 [Candidatus Woesearchaeota archaeon]